MAKRLRGVCAASVEREADFMEAVQVIALVMERLDLRPWRAVEQLKLTQSLRRDLTKLVGLGRAQDAAFWEEVHGAVK